MCRIYFYSRPCGRGDGQQILKVYEAKAISTHAPAGGATAPVPVRSPAGGYFYSRPCGRGDSIVLRFDLKDQISTHAPAGGATGTAQLGGREGSYFYSRPCGRGDLAALRDAAFYLLISTHAPAGGATAALHVPAAFLTKFLLTPLREGRPSSRTSSPGRPDFYSRPCGRGDLVVLRPVFVYEDFYSRPCGRGDSSQASSSSSILYFYSRPCGRGDIPKVGFNVPLVIISTHAPAGGATGYLYDTAAYDSLFLLTPLREGRREATAKAVQRIPISTHAPAGGATQS